MIYFRSKKRKCTFSFLDATKIRRVNFDEPQPSTSSYKPLEQNNEEPTNNPENDQDVQDIRHINGEDTNR